MASELPKKESRVLALSQVKVYKKNVVEAAVQVSWREHVGEANLRGTEIIAAAALAQGLTARPSHLLVIRSHRFPGDVCGIPTAEESEDNISVTWSEQGRIPRLAMPKLLTAEQIAIPRGTKMVISLYLENDPDYGACIGMKLKEAEFRPIRQKQKPETATNQKEQGKDGSEPSKR